MDTIELTIIDERMLQLPAILKDLGMIKFKKDFLDELGMHRQNVQKIKNGEISFTKDQILTACKTYRINANWLLGLEKNIYRK